MLKGGHKRHCWHTAPPVCIVWGICSHDTVASAMPHATPPTFPFSYLVKNLPKSYLKTCLGKFNKLNGKMGKVVVKLGLMMVPDSPDWTV